MTELELVTQLAWVAMMHDIRPMDPAVALDMIQDVCGDRGPAVESLVQHIVAKLDEWRPERFGDGPNSVSLNTSIAVLGGLMDESYAVVEASVKGIRELNRAIRMQVETGVIPYDERADEVSAGWLRWCCYVERQLRFCRGITAAARPVAA